MKPNMLGYPSNQEQETLKKIDHYSFCTSNVLGRGNFSTVYAGKNQLNNQPVAIKVVKLNFLNSTVARKLLDNQVSILKILNHPNLLACYDVLFSVNNCYIVTEICQKGDLDQILRVRGSFEQKQIKKIAWDIYQGMLHLHSLKIVHRDIKIANVFLKANGSAKIADFGFAIRAEGQFRDINIGSPIYMSPESLLRREYSQKSDVWAFGMLLYELSHNDTHLSKCKTEEELRIKILQPVKYKVNLSRDLRELIEMCLQINVKNRIDVVSIANTKYFSCNYEQKIEKNINPFSISHNSTNVSNFHEQYKLWFGKLTYDSTVALIHYCRFLHKFSKKHPSQKLSAFLLLISEALVESESKNVDADKSIKLKQVICQYHTKYLKEHKDYELNVGFDQFCLELQSIKGGHISILKKETQMLKNCYIRKKLEIFEKESQCRQILEFKLF